MKKFVYIIKLLVGKNKMLFCLLLFLNILTAILTPLVPQIIGVMTDSLRGNEVNLGGIFSWAQTPLAVTVLFVLCGICKIIFSFAAGITDRMFQNRITWQLKSTLHDKLLSLDASYHNQHDQGENTFNVNNVNGVVNAVTMCSILPVSCVIGLCITINYLCERLSSVNGIPSWVIWCIIPALLVQPFVGRYLGKKINKAFNKLRSLSVAANEELLNSMKSPLEVQVMNARKQRSQAFLTALKKVAAASNKANIFAAFDNQFSSVCILIFQSIIALVIVTFYTSGEQVDTGIAGALITCILLVPQVFDQIGAFIASYIQLKQVEPEINAACNILHTESSLPEAPDAETLALQQPVDIEFKKLSFGYGENLILQDISLRIPAGKTIAVVSHSGGGKSTLLHLLSRLYDPLAGSVVIGDRDIRKYTLSSLRNTVMRISQFPLFIQGSLRDNFHLQHPGADDRTIEQVCRQTGILEILKEQNQNRNPIDMQLSPGAENLSGGQRRLLAIARAMLKKPAIMLLDEPTTGVDAQTIQDRIYPFLQEYKKHSSIVLVDHNMNFVRKIADLVLVLENGRVADFGATEDVWSNENSLFRKLWNEYNKNENAF